MKKEQENVLATVQKRHESFLGEMDLQGGFWIKRESDERSLTSSMC